MKFCFDYDVCQLHEQYARAMGRRRPDSILSIESFEYYLEMPNVRVVEYDGSYVVGQWDEELEIFFVSHFAPRRLREGIDMIAWLREQPGVILAVTEDLSDMIWRFGFLFVAEDVPCIFRGEIVFKSVWVTDLKTYDAAVRIGREMREEV